MTNRAILIFAASTYLVLGVFSNAIANPLSELENQNINRLEFGLFKAQYHLSEKLNERRGDQLDGSDLTFRGSTVQHDKKSDRVIILSGFSSQWSDDLTRGACTDALGAFQKRVLASVEGASSARQYLGAIFGSSSMNDELYAQLLGSVRVATVLHNSDRRPVMSCNSNLEGRDLEFRRP